MKKYVWLVVFCIIVVSIIGCGRKRMVEKAAKEGPVLAKVGDEVITLDEFNMKIERLPDNIRPMAENNKAAYLDNLILEALLYKEALKKGLDKDKEMQELFEEAKKRIMIARLAKEDVEDKVEISEKGIREYYEENKDDFMSPELLKASHILVDTLDEAVDIVDRLNAGAIFEELATKYSKDVTNKRGGDIGYFTVGQMIPEFEDACLKLKVGEISGPVKSQFGYHIVKLTDKKKPELMEFDGVKDKIERLLKAEKGRALFDDLVTKLKSGTNITINSELIEAGEPKEAEEISETETTN